MNKHTPGPWNICKKGSTILSIGPCSADEYAGFSWLQIPDSDAALIAAAPDLLQALDALSKSAPSVCCADFDHQPSDYHGADESCPALDRYEAACLAARAAIARARGEL